MLNYSNFLLSSFVSINKYVETCLGITDPKIIKKSKSEGAIYGAYGFIINRKAMKEFLKAATPMTYCVDVILGRIANIDKVVKAYNLKRPYQLISYFKYGTTIHH